MSTCICSRPSYNSGNHPCCERNWDGRNCFACTSSRHGKKIRGRRRCTCPDCQPPTPERTP